MESHETNANLNYSRNKIIVIIIGAVTLIISAIAPQIFGENSSVDVALYYISVIGTNFLVFAWTHYDSLERNQPLGVGWRFLIIFFSLFALLVYLFKTRGFKQGIKAIGWLLLIILIMTIGTILASIIVFLITGKML
jgi:hypothetical protein